MTTSSILTIRLHTHHLLSSKFSKPEQVVKWLGAVQSQDFPAAKWALGIRLNNSTDALVEQAYNEGKFLRTHIMRPTWHFVMPEDIVWMQQLTSHRVKQFAATYNKKLELTEEVFAFTTNIIVKALEKHKYLTRQEIKQILLKEKIETNVQRLAHIMFWPELDGLICSGPKKGKQFTYALLAERAPHAKTLPKEEALAKLAFKYFESHGPAQVKDFSWWSGLTVKDAQLGVELIKEKLEKQIIEEKEYYFSPASHISTFTEPQALLLSIFDEYVIAYKDRSALAGKISAEQMLAMGNALTAVIVLNGGIVGTWKRKLKKDNVEFEINLFNKHSAKEMNAIEKAQEEYKRFVL